MEVVSVCENCKNLTFRAMEPCRFCGFKRKSYGSAFVAFIVILMVLVLLLTIFGMRHLKHPDPNHQSNQQLANSTKK
ncbi:MAG: hypothetical protein EOO69_06220 [Moraxellaceae bacterium]|nr:MAG: hypothetical protein EOO69_06220 [Moraxellaceae bacterium]